MSPEYTDHMGAVHYWNDRLGVKEDIHGSTCKFVKDGDERRIQLNWKGVYNDGKLGWWVGVMEHPVPVFQGYIMPEYQLVVWDGEQGISGIHESRIVFLG